MRHLLFAVSAFFTFDLSAQCGDIQTLTIAQSNQAGAIFNNLESALATRNLQQIDSLNAAAKIVIGTEAGQPEAIENYDTLWGSTTWLPMPQAILLSRALIAADSIYYAQTWRMCKGAMPPLYQPHSAILRGGAEVCIGLLRIAVAETDPARRALYTQWASDGLDSLLTMQLPSGAFPFPDLRTYGDPVFTPIINNYLQSLGADSVNVLVNGWIIDDSGTGEFKFDAGVIGGVFAEAYMLTADTNYRNAAIRVATYLDTIGLNTNYNYNTFQSYGMILGAEVTGTTNDWNLSADTVLRYSVVPGQIPNGRWMDGHNARSVYHSIMIHNLSAGLYYNSAASPWRDTIAASLVAALRNFIDNYYSCGASTGFDGLLRAYRLDAGTVPLTLHDSIGDVIGIYINAAAVDGSFLDVYTMGLYLDSLTFTAPVGETPVQPENISIYPNPAHDIVNIVFTCEESQVYTITLYNAAGQAIGMNLQVAGNTGTVQTNYNTELLLPGLYFFRIAGENEAFSIPWIKE